MLTIETQLKSHQTSEVVWEWVDLTKPKESSELTWGSFLGWMESALPLFCTVLIKSVTCELSEMKTQPDKASCDSLGQLFRITHCLLLNFESAPDLLFVMSESECETCFNPCPGLFYFFFLYGRKISSISLTTDVSCANFSNSSCVKQNSTSYSHNISYS